MRRTQVGEFTIEKALSTENDSGYSKDLLLMNMLAPEKIMSHVPLVYLRNLKFKKAFEAGNVILCQLKDLSWEPNNLSLISKASTDIFLKFDDKAMFFCSCTKDDAEFVKICPKKKII